MQAVSESCGLSRGNWQGEGSLLWHILDRPDLVPLTCTGGLYIASSISVGKGGPWATKERKAYGLGAGQQLEDAPDSPLRGDMD